MKAVKRYCKIRYFILVAAFAVSLPAYAHRGEVVNYPAQSSGTWEHVKQKVEDWWHHWTAPNPATPPSQIVRHDGTSAPAAPSSQNAPSTTAALPPIHVEPTQPYEPLPAQPATDSSYEDIHAAREALKQKPAVSFADQGRHGTSHLKHSKAGVPVFHIGHIRQIPRLDIGREPLLSKSDFTLPNVHWALERPQDLKPLPGPEPVSAKDYHQLRHMKIAPAYGAHSITAQLEKLGHPVTQEDVAAIQYKIDPANKFLVKPYKPFNADQLKMLAALILFNKGSHCHMIMGLFDDLAKKPDVRDEALFHLGSCADQLGMHNAAFEALSELVAKEDPEYGAQALTLLSKDLPKEYEQAFYDLVKKVKNPKMFEKQALDDINYRAGKGAFKYGYYHRSSMYASRVSKEGANWGYAQYLLGISQFALNERPKARATLTALVQWIKDNHVDDSNLRALARVNLARMDFMAKKYNKALPLYIGVPKDHPLWVQALIEQGWTQLAMDDFSGAIGNMYSLHSPYFKVLYQPESFVVRTIGYINICQYGDAYQTLTELEKQYRGWYNRTNAYLSAGRSSSAVYRTVKTYLKGKSTRDVDNLPYQVIREVARHKDFLNLQSDINAKSDELGRYNGVNREIKKEKASIRWHARESKKQFSQIRAKIVAAHKNRDTQNINSLMANLRLERDRTMGYRFQLAILEQSREGYLRFQKRSEKEIAARESKLIAETRSTLYSHMKSLKQEMSRVLSNNEFLRYEVFADSGENIRYQVEGGKVAGPNRIPASVKPEKALNWSFDGEYWEDEIGSYRSSLQNNCPKNGDASTHSESNQASLEKGSKE